MEKKECNICNNSGIRVCGREIIPCIICHPTKKKQKIKEITISNETITQIVDKYRKTNITNKDFSDRLTKAKKT